MVAEELPMVPAFCFQQCTRESLPAIQVDDSLVHIPTPVVRQPESVSVDSLLQQMLDTMHGMEAYTTCPLKTSTTKLFQSSRNGSRFQLAVGTKYHLERMAE
jgi:hypothetical protein